MTVLSDDVLQRYHEAEAGGDDDLLASCRQHNRCVDVSLDVYTPCLKNDSLCLSS